jgi:hypothetical protein
MMSKVKYVKKPHYGNKSYKGKTQAQWICKWNEEKENPVSKGCKLPDGFQ